MKRVLGGPTLGPGSALIWDRFFFLDKRDQFESNFMQTDFNNSSVFRFKKFARSVKSWKRLFRIGKNVIGRNSIMERIFLREKIWALFFF